MGVELDRRYIAVASAEEIAESLAMWPQFAARRIRPLFVTALGDIYYETDSLDVWVASPIDFRFERVAESNAELESRLLDQTFGQRVLQVHLVDRAMAQRPDRQPEQVFAIAPHPFVHPQAQPTFVVMSLRIWHYMALQIYEQATALPPGAGVTGYELT
jgi:hypothetical protein